MTAVKRITFQEPLPQLKRAREPLFFIVLVDFRRRKDLLGSRDQRQSFFLLGMQDYFAQSCFDLI